MAQHKGKKILEKEKEMNSEQCYNNQFTNLEDCLYTIIEQIEKVTNILEKPSEAECNHECWSGPRKTIRCYEDHGKLYLEFREQTMTYPVTYCPYCGKREKEKL